MENLIDLNSHQPNLQFPMQSSNKVFGIIKRECNAIDLSGMDDNLSEKLKPGTLIQIIPDYRGDQCHFKIRDFTNWCDKYKTTIYKCSKDDYIAVAVNLWPYLTALKNDDGRIKFVNKVYSREFDMDILQLGREIRIRNNSNRFYEFVVKYIGVVKEIGTGHYIGLQSKNNHIPLTPELKCLSRYYDTLKWGGTGIVVPADWIMLNLFKEVESNPTPPHTIKPAENSAPVDKSIDEIASEVTESKDRETREKDPFSELNEIAKNNIDGFRNSKPITANDKTIIATNLSEPSAMVYGSVSTRPPLIPIQTTNKIKDTGAEPKQHRNAPETKCDSTYTNQSHTEEIELINSSTGAVRNIEITKCDLCDKTVEKMCGVILRECLHTFCKPCISNYIEHNSKYSGIRCPYNKDYICQFDLLDSEIKDLGEDYIYNKILNNRLKEFVSNDPNAIVCSNDKCRNIWVESNHEHKNFVKCPKCMTFWCNLCKSAHEPNQQHGNKQDKSKSWKITEWLGKTILGIEEPQPTTTCSKCHTSKHSNCEYFSLKNCPHIFCKDCVVPMIKTQTSGSKYACCTICKAKLDDDEVKTITGIDILNLFVDNRNKSSKTTQFCVCQSSTNCGIDLQCGHQMCQKILSNLIKQQWQFKKRAACPICFNVIDSQQIKSIIGNKGQVVIDRCSKCPKQANMHLENCGHPFCSKCIHDLVRSQVADKNKIGINCFSCNDIITDKDILQYGSEEILALFKSNVEAATAIPKPIDHITLNDRPFMCTSCDKWIPIKKGVIFAKCRDSICLECCNEFIQKQLSKSQVPKCIFCQLVIEQFEIDAIITKPIDVGTEIECLKCEEKFGEGLIQQCPHCNNPICITCAGETISGQLENNRAPNCLFCHTLLDESQIDSIRNATFTMQTERKMHDESIPSHLANMQFLCLVCEKSVEPTSQIVLINCKHQICRTCLQVNISDQSALCPLCSKPIDQKQLETLGLLTINNYESKVDGSLASKIGRHDTFTMQTSSSSNAICGIDLNNSFECIVCDQVSERSSQIVLPNCKHQICKQCFDVKISEQMTWSSEKHCPICAKPIDQSPDKYEKVTSNKITMESSQNSVIFGNQTLPSSILCDEVNFKPNIPLPLNIDPFECPCCDKNIEPECGVILVNCGHNLCRDCISDVISQQSTNDLAPSCPLCKTLITQDVFRTVDPGVRNIIEENQLDRVVSPGLIDSNMMNIEDDEMCFCVICEETFLPNVIKVLACDDKFCRPCITTALNDQSSHNTTPRCPLCSSEVSGVDIYDLCGQTVFKLFLDNKRNKK